MRQPDLAAENNALLRLGQQMAENPDNLLRFLAGLALELCQAGSAGVSLLEGAPGGDALFKWVALAGEFAVYEDGATPHDWSPCGVCLDQGKPVLLSYPARHYTYLQQVPIPIVEVLVIPLMAGREPLGTIWVVSHEEGRKFDLEDVRVMVNLAHFTGAALHINAVRRTAEENRVRLQKSEAALRDTAGHFRLALNAAQMGAWDLDLGSNSISWSENVGLLFGFSAGAGKIDFDTLLDRVHPEDRDVIKRAMRDAIQGGTDYNVEFRVLGPDGSLHWQANCGRVVCDEDGQPARMIGLGRDITGLKQAAEELAQRVRLSALTADIAVALTENEQLQPALQRCMASLVSHLDLAFARVWALNQSEEMLELVASAGLYTHTNGPHARVPVGQFKIGLIAQNREPHLTNEVLNDPGISDPEWARREGMVAFAGHPLIVDGRLVGVMAMFARHALSSEVLRALQSVAHVISVGVERKRADDVRRILTSVVQHSPDFIGIGTPDQETLFVNRAGQKLLGFSGDEQIKEALIADYFPEEDQQFIEETVMTALREQGTWNGDVRIKNFQTSAITPMSWNIFTIPAESTGQRNAYACIARDITSQKQAEQALLELNLKLQQSNEELQHFAEAASHDLHEPLRTVSTYAELLAQRYTGRLDTQADQMIVHITRAAQRMSLLITDLLRYARATQQMEMPAVDVPMEEVLDSVRINLETSIRDTTAVITHDPLPTLRADPVRLGQVLQNLISNAIKYRRDETPRIHISAEQRAGEWIVSVRDNGQGFDPKYSDVIFQPFKRLHGQNYPGTGIGLALCKKIVNQHGGRIWAESEIGAGSTFSFTLK